MRIYVAGKVSKESVFGTHHWRDEFVRTLAALSGLSLTNLDPTRLESNQNDPEMVYGADAYLISQADCLIVYLSDDISVGGSQEILIAKYFKKPVIGLAPRGGGPGTAAAPSPASVSGPGTGASAPMPAAPAMPSSVIPPPSPPAAAAPPWCKTGNSR